MRGPNGEPGRLFLLSTTAGSHARALYPSDSSGNELDKGRFPDCHNPPSAHDFFPHGLNAVSTKEGAELYVVNHGGREAIEFFRVTVGGAPHAAWIGCVLLPGHAFGNGVAPLPDGGFVVSKMYDTLDRDFIQKFAAAQPTGGVLRWKPRDGWADAISQPLSGANGVEVSRDGNWLYVSEWAARKLWVFPLKDHSAPRHIDLDFLPDNLRWTDHGTLLLAGQDAKPEELFGCDARKSPSSEVHRGGS